MPPDILRLVCLLAAKAAKGLIIGIIFADFLDLNGSRLARIAAAKEGSTVRIAIHPDQVGPINAAFMPPNDGVAHATRIIATFAANPAAGAVGLDGKIFAMPYLKQAQNVLALHASYAGRGEGRRAFQASVSLDRLLRRQSTRHLAQRFLMLLVRNRGEVTCQLKRHAQAR
jgi:hypothetical protein